MYSSVLTDIQPPIGNPDSGRSCRHHLYGGLFAVYRRPEFNPSFLLGGFLPMRNIPRMFLVVLGEISVHCGS